MPPAATVGISVVIPARNEADNIAWVLQRIPAFVDEVVIVDGRSSDDTIDVARLVRPDVVVVSDNGRGKGDALRVGAQAARGSIVVMIDADGSMDPGEIERYVEPLAQDFDFVKGSRFLPGGGTADMTNLRKAGHAVLLGLANFLYGGRWTDLCYGFCAFRRSALEELALDADGFEIETQMVVRAARIHLRITEVPSFEFPRRFGNSQLNTFRDGWRVLVTIFEERIKRHPAPASRNRAWRTSSPMPDAHDVSTGAARASTVSVVVCTHTVARRQMLENLIESIAVGSLRPVEVVVVVDRNRPLYEDLEDAELAAAAARHRESRQWPLRRTERRLAERHRAARRVHRRRRGRHAGLARGAGRAVGRHARRRRRRRDRAEVDRRGAGLVQPATGLGRRLQLRGPAARGGPRPQRHRLQHAVPARAARAARWLRYDARPNEQRPRRVRGDRAVHPRQSRGGRRRPHSRRERLADPAGRPAAVPLRREARLGRRSFEATARRDARPGARDRVHLCPRAPPADGPMDRSGILHRRAATSDTPLD